MKKSHLLMLMAVFSLILGCSGVNTPIEPTTPELSASAADGPSHSLWGMWQFAADPQAGTLDVTARRCADMHLNALRFLEPPAYIYLNVHNIQFSGNKLDCDVSLRHPFLGAPQYTGFDACGILITHGTKSGFLDPDLAMPGEGDIRLLNPDGYTRWWNPVEFPHTDTMLGYRDGLLGTPDGVAGFTATLNPYKLFCDDLSDPGAPLSSLSPTLRCHFTAGQENLRHYTIELTPTGLIFNYAIDACWALPNGSPPWDVPDDFGPAANRPEAWNATVDETLNTLWNDGASSGGKLSLRVELWDHYNPQLNMVYVESPGNFDPLGPLEPPIASEHTAICDIAIESATPAMGSIEILIYAECEKTGYQDLLPGKPVTAYFTHTAIVKSEPQGEGIYVDDSNDTGVEDGSQDHPYNTIGEGLDAASPGNTVYVDDSGNPYEEQVILVSEVTLESLNWDISDGGDRATIDWTSGPTVIGTDDATIEGFLVTGKPTGIECMGASPEIIDCHVAHIGNVSARGIYVHSSGEPVFEDVEVYDIHDATDYGYSTFSGVLYKDCLYDEQYRLEGLEVYEIRTDEHSNYCHPTGIRIEGCNNMLVTHNIVHEVTTYNPELGGSYSYPTGIRVEGSDYIQVRNNIVYDVDGGNYKECFGICFIDSDNCKCGNNVIYDVRKNYYYGTAYGISAEGSFDICMKNSIVYKVKLSGGFQSAYGVRISDCAPYCFEYMDVYDCSSGYYDGFTPGVGCINANPLFVAPDAVPPDFHLQAGSPCIDAGDPKPEYNDPDGSRNDMGAYGGPYGDWG